MTIRVLLSCTDRLLAAGLSALLDGQSDLDVTAEPAELSPELVRTRQPDVLVVARPGGLGDDLIRELSECTAVILLAGADTDGQAMRALTAGARGVLGAGPTPDELLAAIRVVAAGPGLIVPPDLLGSLHGVSAGSAGEAAATLTTLTAREHDVLRLLAHGLSNVDIARTLFVSTSTVRSHVHHLLGKLHAKSRAQAVTVAYRAGLIGGLGGAGNGRGTYDGAPARLGTGVAG